MKNKNPNYLILLAFLLLPFCFSCHFKKTGRTLAEHPIWTPISIKVLKQSKDSLPKKFIVFQLDEDGLRKKLSLDSSKIMVVEAFPTPDSTFINYSIMEVQVMSPALAAKYPKFKTYEGIEVSNKVNRVRIDFNDKNFHAYFMTTNGEYFITPVDGVEKNYYMVFKKEDSPFPKLPFEEGKH